MENPSENFSRLGWLFATVNIALFIHGFIILPLIYSILTKKMPFTFIKNQFPAMATAFGTSSSAAALPGGSHLRKKITLNKTEKPFIPRLPEEKFQT